MPALISHPKTADKDVWAQDLHATVYDMCVWWFIADW